MRIAIDLDDFSVYNHRLDLLLQLKEFYPQFKISMFTIPFDYVNEMSPSQRLMRDDNLRRIKENLDWIQIIPHGLSHIPREFDKCDRWTMKMALQSITEAFEHDNLPFEKGFKAPYWLWNQEVVDVLNEEGWWGAIDRNQPDMLKTKRFYKYNHSIDEMFWEHKDEVLKLHGHMSLPSNNNLEDCMPNLLHIDPKAEFNFITDYLEDEKI